jgi:transposase InsO family protein
VRVGVTDAPVLSLAGPVLPQAPNEHRQVCCTEFTSKLLDHWAYWHHVGLEFSRPGKPVDNTFIEAFNGTLRRE